jgi:MFS family permease
LDTSGSDLTVSDTGSGDIATREQDTRRTWSIGLLSLDIYFFWFSLYLFVPVLSVYAKSLGASLSMVGLIISAYGFTQLIVRIPIGMLSDRLGRRLPFVIVAFAMVVISVAGLAWSPNPTWLLIFRGLTGLAAATWVTTTVLYTSYFHKNLAVRAIGMATFFQGMAIVMATAAGGILAESYGWVSTFYLALIPAVLGIILAFFLADDVTIDRTRLFSPKMLPKMRGIGLLLTASVLGCLTQYTNYSTTFSFVPIYATDIGASRISLGWLSTGVFLTYTAGSLVSARLADRVGERKLIIAGLVIMGLMTTSIPFIHSVPLLIASRVVYGIGSGISFPVVMGLSIKRVDREQRASAMGFFQAVYAVGMSAGPAFSGIIADGIGISGMFYTVGLLCFLSTLVAFRFVPHHS